MRGGLLPADAATQATALNWVNEFIVLSNETMVPFAADLLVSVLPSLSHKMTGALRFVEARGAPSADRWLTPLHAVRVRAARAAAIRSIAQEADINLMNVMVETSTPLDYQRLRTVLLFQVRGAARSMGNEAAVRSPSMSAPTARRRRSCWTKPRTRAWPRWSGCACCTAKTPPRYGPTP